MTRLIDADALNLDYEVDMADDWKTAHEIANIVKYAPTVDAIPIEWIMRYSFDGKRKRPISITEMIADWRKEHAEAD